MTYDPTAWNDYAVPCINAANLNKMEHGIDIAQGDVMVLRDVTANIPASDPELVGRFYIETDLLLRIWRDNGAGWDLVPTGIAVNYRRYLWAHPYSQGAYIYQLAGLAGRVYITPIDVSWDMTIDRLIWWNEAVSAGNVRLGLYREGGAGDTPQAGALVVETASVAVPGIFSMHPVAVADTVVTAGLYYIAIQLDDVTMRIEAHRDNASELSYWYDRAGGYGAFTDPCPVVVALNRNISFGTRVKSIP